MPAVGFLQQTVTQALQTSGEQLTLTRDATTQGGTPTTQLLYCLPQPVSVVAAQRLQSEGILNLAESIPHRFVFDGASDVAESTDVIAYNGFNWRVLTV